MGSLTLDSNTYSYSQFEENVSKGPAFPNAAHTSLADPTLSAHPNAAHTSLADPTLSAHPNAANTSLADPTQGAHPNPAHTFARSDCARFSGAFPCAPGDDLCAAVYKASGCGK